MTADIFQAYAFHLRTRLIKATILVSFLIGGLLSPQLWLSHGRLFPIIPPIDGMYVLPTSINFILMSLFAVLSVFWIFYEKRSIGFIAVSSLVIVIVQDQMRWQPWVYMYSLMLIPYLAQTGKDDRNRSILICLQWIIAGVYFWSGIQKLNSNFLDGTFAQIIKASGLELEFQSWRNVGYAVASIEVAIGVGLLIPRFRMIATNTAIVTHLLILFYLSPVVQNYNSVVYPWNVAMIFFVALLYWNVKENFFLALSDFRSNVMMLLPVVLVWVFPIFNLFGYWDHYLSFSLYSNKPASYFIAIERSQLHKLDKRLSDYFADIPGLQGGQMIDVNKWAFTELNVPFYPEMRSFKKLSLNFCELGIDTEKLIFLELSNAKGKPHYRRFTCGDLK